MNISNRVKFNFDVNMPLSENLCEFIGAFIGDAFTNRYSRNCMTQFTGHSKLDKDYYESYIIPYSKLLFNNIVPRVYKKDNTIRINYYSKILFLFLTERFKFKAGKKCYDVIIPDEIMNSKKKFIFATIRGIFDTDGYVYFDKRLIYREPYLIIDLHMNNPSLLNQLNVILRKYGYKPYLRKTNNHLIIMGKIQTKKFLTEIGFHNKRHKSKLKGSWSSGYDITLTS